jgi:hypothetical protein
MSPMKKAIRTMIRSGRPFGSKIFLAYLLTYDIADHLAEGTGQLQRRIHDRKPDAGTVHSGAWPVIDRIVGHGDITAA